MSAARKTAVVVCPGRGSYNKAELGYLYRHHDDKTGLIRDMDRYRREHQQATLSELDLASRYDPQVHSRGDHASSLIYACALADYLSIDPQRIEIVAITGNSMGWYIALACAAALNQNAALRLINSMGNLMHRRATGGQLIYPLLDENWQPVPGRLEQLAATSRDINSQAGCELYDSIYLGGIRVFAGNDAALDTLAQSLAVDSIYPLRLPNHAAYHSPIMQDISVRARETIEQGNFGAPDIPLVDGRGAIWNPLSSDRYALWDYTTGHQILRPYDFTRAVQVCVKEFAPDYLILPGPGNSLGAVTAQALLDIRWQGMQSKADFTAHQQRQPLVISMGLASQRSLVT